MTIRWVRVDSQFYTHPKVLNLLDDGQHRALNVYVFSLGYAGAHGTDGFIPRTALRVIHGRPRDAEALVTVGLWNECAAGWDIQSWADYQPTHAETQARKERAKRGATARWSKQEHDPPVTPVDA